MCRRLAGMMAYQGGAAPYGMVAMSPYGYIPMRPGQDAAAAMGNYAAAAAQHMAAMGYGQYAQAPQAMGMTMSPVGGMQVGSSVLIGETVVACDLVDLEECTAQSCDSLPAEGCRSNLLGEATLL
jgi:hypothetical protein